MKKFLFALVCILCLPLLSSCKKTVCDESLISQLKPNIFYYEEDDFKIYAFPETSENPLVSDGFVGKKESFLTFKLFLPSKSTLLVVPNIKVCLYDEEYSSQFDYDTSSNYLLCKIKAEELPEENFFAKLDLNGKTHDVEFSSLKQTNNFDYKDAVKLTLSSNDKTVKKLVSEGKSYEIRVKLIESEGFNYWVVGIIGESESVSLLFDAENGELIATKNN